MIVRALGLVALACAAGVQEPEPRVAVDLAIVGGVVFPATDADAIEDGVVLVADDRIVAVGPAAEVAVPDGVERIDAAGGFVMPGLVDAHVHLVVDVVGQRDSLTPWARAGVTTLVDVGTGRGMAASTREGAAVLGVPAPHVLVAGPIHTAPGGYPATRHEEGVELVAHGIDSPEDARAAVRALVEDEGVDVVKAAVEAGFRADLGDEDAWPTPAPAVLAAIVAEAHRLDRIAHAHVTHPRETAAALDAGFDVLAHTPIVPLPDALLERAADADVVLVTTAAIWGRAGTAAAVDNLRRYHALGGPIAVGTDYPYQRGSRAPLRELAALREAGLDGDAVLRAATAAAARACGGADAFGTLEPGKRADVLVLGADPRADLDAFEEVVAVVLAGERVR